MRNRFCSPGGLIRRPALLVMASMLMACGQLLDVEDPDIIDPDQIQGIEGAIAAYNGALGDFAAAKDGTGNGPGGGGELGVVQAGGWFSDEFKFANAGLPVLRLFDLRALQPEIVWEGTYRNLHVARVAAEGAAELFRDVASNPSEESRIGELYALSGLVHVLLGEHYCQGIPFSEAGAEIEYGEPLSLDQVMDRALTRLDLADQFAGGDSDVASLARVVRGRALLNKGDYAAAAAAVAPVATAFRYQSLHSAGSDRQANAMYVQNAEFPQYSVSDREGVNGLDFATANDPRVPTQYLGPSPLDGVTPLYRYLTLDSRAAPVETASGIEARLIEAEALLNDGRVAEWLATLNAARATVGLDPLTDPGSASAREDLLFRERAFWLFNTGHRLGDLRRLVRQYDRNPLTVFPTGAYHKDGLTIGTDLAIVIPANEEGNPRYVACNNQVG